MFCIDRICLLFVIFNFMYVVTIQLNQHCTVAFWVRQYSENESIISGSGFYMVILTRSNMSCSFCSVSLWLSRNSFKPLTQDGSRKCIETKSPIVIPSSEVLGHTTNHPPKDHFNSCMFHYHVSLVLYRICKQILDQLGT